jgi:hypothetical protein
MNGPDQLQYFGEQLTVFFFHFGLLVSGETIAKMDPKHSAKLFGAVVT